MNPMNVFLTKTYCCTSIHVPISSNNTSTVVSNTTINLSKGSCFSSPPSSHSSYSTYETFGDGALADTNFVELYLSPSINDIHNVPTKVLVSEVKATDVENGGMMKLC